MIQFLYNLCIRLFGIGLYLFSFFNKKAAIRIKGLGGPKRQTDKDSILVHCSSAGEFEQVYPIIQQLQRNCTNHQIVVSFFSASGVQWFVKKGISLPYYYLPIDHPKKMQSFIAHIQPSLVIVVKNEFWMNFFQSILNAQIPLVLVATAFKKNHFTLRFRYFREILNRCHHIFTLDQRSLQYGQEELNNISLGGDPRIDRIIQVAKEAIYPKKLDLQSALRTIVYASVHREDVPIIQRVIQNTQYQHIIVPHDIHDSEIAYFKKELSVDCHTFSTMSSWDGAPIIVDKIGILAAIYKQAEISYIGGGFGNGIHNLLESAIFKNIILIGPKNNHFPEARYLLQKKAIIEIQSETNIIEIIEDLEDKTIQKMQSEMQSFFLEHQGASARISDKITDYICK